MIIALKIYFNEPSDNKTSTTKLLGAETGLFLMFSKMLLYFYKGLPLCLWNKKVEKHV